MKLLIVTSEPITAQQLRSALGGAADPDQTEVMVVAPALADSPFRFWVSDADAAIERANTVRNETVQQLADEGVDVAGGQTGEADPMQAITDALQTFAAERIVLFTHADGDAQRYREDLDEAELQERFGLPVDRSSLA